MPALTTTGALPVAPETPLLAHRLYYGLKPYLPWRVRIAVRRIAAQRKRAAVTDRWPIDPAAAAAPAGWPGWPDGKRFALVLTHDVEGPSGFDKCAQVAALERKLGFRSAFNFIPEGEYQPDESLRRELVEQGFEVGIHDLRHDGKLFHSREGFARSATRINRYIREWGASGFRSGFMLRNLAWLHDLEIEYDSSTFDTDPFEPQSDGAGTIFPFWIDSPPADRGGADPASARAHGGYVELPYTLPQDSTLFLVLREASPKVWFDKLDWVARHGGMAMVNVHPDYMGFGRVRRANEYPAEFFGQLLRYVHEKYSNQFWNATPREVSSWVRRSRGLAVPRARARPATLSPSALPGASVLAGRKAAVLLYSNYPADPRPRRAAETMIAAGMEVDLLCLAGRDGNAPTEEVVNGVRVSRVRLLHRRDSRLGYLWQYGRFFLASFWYLTWRRGGRRYDVVHVHNMPDFLAFAALWPKLRGAKVILDLHDPMPELMMSIYELRAGDWRVTLLRWLERASIGFANLVLTPNRSFKDLFAARSCRPEKIEIVMNSPEERIFDPNRHADAEPAPRTDGEFRVMHHGSILHRHGVDLLVVAIARLRRQIPGLVLDIYGFRDPFLDVVLQTAVDHGISDIVRYHGPKTQAEIAAAIRECDVGVVPNRLSPFTNLNFPTRLFEYLSMHRPVIAPNTTGIRDYFGHDDLITFEPENVDSLVERLAWVHAHRTEAQAVVARGIAVYRQHLWQHERRRLTAIAARLLSR